MNDDQNKTKFAAPGDLVRVTRRPAVSMTLEPGKSTRFPQWVARGFMGKVPSGTLALVCGVLETNSERFVWYYAVTPTVVGWVQDMLKNSIEPYIVEVAERAP